MKDLGATNFSLGMEIRGDWVKKKLCLNQTKYVKKIFELFNMRGYTMVKVHILIGVYHET